MKRTKEKSRIESPHHAQKKEVSPVVTKKRKEQEKGMSAPSSSNSNRPTSMGYSTQQSRQQSLVDQLLANRHRERQLHSENKDRRERFAVAGAVAHQLSAKGITESLIQEKQQRRRETTSAPPGSRDDTASTVSTTTTTTTTAASSAALPSASLSSSLIRHGRRRDESTSEPLPLGNDGAPRHHVAPSQDSRDRTRAVPAQDDDDEEEEHGHIVQIRDDRFIRKEVLGLDTVVVAAAAPSSSSSATTTAAVTAGSSSSSNSMVVRPNPRMAPVAVSGIPRTPPTVVGSTASSSATTNGSSPTTTTAQRVGSTAPPLPTTTKPTATFSGVVPLSSAQRNNGGIRSVLKRHPVPRKHDRHVHFHRLDPSRIPTKQSSSAAGRGAQTEDDDDSSLPPLDLTIILIPVAEEELSLRSSYRELVPPNWRATVEGQLQQEDGGGADLNNVGEEGLLASDGGGSWGSKTVMWSKQQSTSQNSKPEQASGGPPPQQRGWGKDSDEFARAWGLAAATPPSSACAAKPAHCESGPTVRNHHNPTGSSSSTATRASFHTGLSAEEARLLEAIANVQAKIGNSAAASSQQQQRRGGGGGGAAAPRPKKRVLQDPPPPPPAPASSNNGGVGNNNIMHNINNDGIAPFQTMSLGKPRAVPSSSVLRAMPTATRQAAGGVRVVQCNPTGATPHLSDDMFMTPEPSSAPAAKYPPPSSDTFSAPPPLPAGPQQLQQRRPPPPPTAPPPPRMPSHQPHRGGGRGGDSPDDDDDEGLSAPLPAPPCASSSSASRSNSAPPLLALLPVRKSENSAVVRRDRFGKRMNIIPR